MNISFIILIIVALISLTLGLLARKGRQMNLEEYSVGGRKFGTLFVFLLMAGEIYTTFTLLGGSAFSYNKGALVYYILSYATLAYVISYFMLPPIWKYAKQHHIVSQADYFSHRFNNKYLGIFVAIVGVVALFPYMVLQLKGLGIIVNVASNGSISPNVSIILGAIVITLYVMTSGIRGSAWIAAFKDILITIMTLFLGFYLPYHYFGGVENMFHAISAQKPNFIIFADRGDIIWYQTTALLSALGFFVWPQSFLAAFTAKSQNVIKRNAIIFPTYALMLLLIFFVGFSASLIIPGLTGTDTDLALLKLSAKTFSPLVMGIIGAAGFLTAIVPGSVFLTVCSMLIANDIYRPLYTHRRISDLHITRIARLSIPLLAFIMVLLTVYGGTTITALFLLGYGFVAQLFPPVIFSLIKKYRSNNMPINATGVFAGVTVGLCIVISSSVFHLSASDFLPLLNKNVNTSLLAVIVNALITLLVSFISQACRKKSTTNAHKHDSISVKS